MTIAIQRQPRLQKVLMALGLVALLAALAIGAGMVTGRDDARSPAVIGASRHAGLGERFESVQDGYLTPKAIVDRQAALDAEIRVQDGFLPPATPTPRFGPQ
jgi:hypothetical protein